MKKFSEIDNTRLKDLIIKFKERPSKEAEDAFLKEVYKADLIAVSRVKKSNKDRGLDLDFLLLQDANKNFLFPVFLDIESFNTFAKDKDLTPLSYNFDRFKKLFENPSNNAYGLALDPFNLNLVLKKDVFTITRENKTDFSKAKIFEPTIYPTAMVNALFELLSRDEGAKKAYIKSMVLDDVNYFLIVYDTDGVEIDLVRKLDAVAKDLSKGRKIYYAGLNSELGKKAIHEFDIAFYER